MKRGALLAALVVALAGCGDEDGGGDYAAPAESGIVELGNVLDLRAAFEADAGKTRLLVLLSPTCGTCVAGARWVREHVLDAEPSEQLRVYAVWLDQRPTDARDTIDESTLDDPRVTQYWDGTGVTGTHFAETDLGGLGYSGFVYDSYYVFGPDARWDDEPAPLAAAGAPVLHDGEALLAALEAQL